jgi:hypothetical protein
MLLCYMLSLYCQSLYRPTVSCYSTLREFYFIVVVTPPSWCFNLNWSRFLFFKAQIAIAAEAPINTLLLLLPIQIYDKETRDFALYFQ